MMIRWGYSPHHIIEFISGMNIVDTTDKLVKMEVTPNQSYEEMLHDELCAYTSMRYGPDCEYEMYEPDLVELMDGCSLYDIGCIPCDDIETQTWTRFSIFQDNTRLDTIMARLVNGQFDVVERSM